MCLKQGETSLVFAGAGRLAGIARRWSGMSVRSALLFSSELEVKEGTLR